MVFDKTYKDLPAGAPQKIWLLQQLDSQDLLWPYGEDQVEWLERSMKKLDGQFREYVLAVFHAYTSTRVSVYKKTSFRKVKARSAVLYAERELETLDCAFYAQVLNFLSANEKSVGLEPPPHLLPEGDISFSC
ncbi:hypothetical protein RvY_11349-3 [Ramazzottius varieornatus]|uniref:Uncharacterized protein n=1 Tax=Ramazzottius varieornatus TaxID=947166 RepID=A0A1D1VK67_RAMVA|nr:hypothetical protein RvY_11349-3 [Ramazzottius varieornatus]